MATVSLYSPQEQTTRMYVGSEDEIKVWLNGTFDLRAPQSLTWGNDYQ